MTISPHALSNQIARLILKPNFCAANCCGHSQAQFVSDVVDHNQNIQAALEAPRFTKHSFEGCDVEMEALVPQAIRAELTGKGHEIKVLADFDSDAGGGPAVMRDFAVAINYGASDPRKDGAAVAEK